MHKSQAELEEFLQTFMNVSSYTKSPELEAIVCPPFTMLEKAQEMFSAKGISVAAQNCHEKPSGAYTGEVAISMLKEIGINSVVIGHSERRQYYGETDESVAAKVVACLEAEVRPIVCVGETKEERESNQTEKVLETQMGAVLEAVSDLKDMIIAYEPVWAIGTGLTATKEEAEAAHKFIRGLVRAKDPSAADKVSILYGGSVKPGNISSLIEQENVDGALIGGASLNPEDFGTIVATSQNS